MLLLRSWRFTSLALNWFEFSKCISACSIKHNCNTVVYIRFRLKLLTRFSVQNAHQTKNITSSLKSRVEAQVVGRETENFTPPFSTLKFHTSILLPKQGTNYQYRTLKWLHVPLKTLKVWISDAGCCKRTWKSRPYSLEPINSAFGALQFKAWLYYKLEMLCTMRCWGVLFSFNI